MSVINKDFDDYLKNEVESGEMDRKANQKRKQVKPSFSIDECAKESKLLPRKKKSQRKAKRKVIVNLKDSDNEHEILLGKYSDGKKQAMLP